MFEHAIFFGPREGSADSVIEQMAPLIIQEVSADQIAKPNLAFFGTNLPADPRTPTVYFRRESVKIAGVFHDRLEYEWRYPSALTAKGFIPSESFGLVITLAESGRPLIYEAHTGASRVIRYYVSTSLEAAAKQEFGQPLGERKYSIEGDHGEAPSVVGTIDDGPMPLGPYIYLTAGSHREIVAVTCRCEKSLAKSFVAEPRYDLESWDSWMNPEAKQILPSRASPSPDSRSSSAVHDVAALEHVPSMDKSFRWPTKIPY